MASPKPTGLVKINSVNTQGSKSDILTSARQQLERTSEPAFAAIQEAGAAPPSWKLTPHPHFPNISTGQITQPRANSRAQPIFVAVQHASGRKNPRPSRNNQILMSNQSFMDVSELTSGKTGPGIRPPLMVETATAMVATMHQPSNAKGLAQAQIRDQWADPSQQAGKKRKLAAMVGDANIENGRITTAIKATGGHVVSPVGATQQSGGTLDHGIFNTSHASVTTGTAMSGDHTFQQFLMHD